MEYFSNKITEVLTQLGIDGSRVSLGNSVLDYSEALVVFVLLLIAFKLFQTLLLVNLKRLASKTQTDVDDTFIKIIESIKPPFYSFVAVYLAVQFLVVSSFIEKLIDVVLIIWIVYEVVSVFQILVSYIIAKRFQKEQDTATRSALIMLGKITKGVLWAVGILMILSNLGINITSLVAGLGIGGIAIAFALQNILTDLFSSFAIYFDKPFMVGDFITVGKDSGVVEKIGIKTTRIRALSGEELVISNKELTTARIQNFKRLKERRLDIVLGVVYGTKKEQLEKIPGMLKEIISHVPKTRFDRAHFKTFAPSSLDFEIVAYVESADYAEFMDAREKINLGIVERFEKEGIVFAYPTQTVYIEK
ncbi:MAG: mechanosensitive ion channel family protein [Candidatus Paceibacterota bacterium]